MYTARDCSSQALPRTAGEKKDQAAPNVPLPSGVHKGGFSQVGFSNNHNNNNIVIIMIMIIIIVIMIIIIIITHKLLNPPLHNPPL